VFIDNQEVGRTPLTRELPFGSHAVRAELPNFKPANRSLRLAGPALSVALELQPAAVTGTLIIVGPAGSRIKMDGQDLGASPATVSTTEGNHSFEVVLPDGTSRRSSRTVQFAAQSRATIEL
jgi:hypothetical protein